MRYPKIQQLAALAGALTLAWAAAIMLVGVAGPASASTRPASPAVSGTEHFYLMTTQPSTSRYTIIATGVFTVGGTDRSGSKADLIRLPGGTFKIQHGGPFHIVKQQLNQKTCLGRLEATARFTVGNGTGAYRRISGSGKAVISSMFIARRSKGACNPNLNPLVLEQTITAKAHIRL